MKRLTQMILAILLGVAMTAQAQQSPNPTQVQNSRSTDNPVYTITVNVVERTIPAINYRNRSGSTKVDFRGTPLLADARGEAKVESEKGYTSINVEFDKLEPATRYGPEFLTYVMWAITPEGRTKNLGEVILDGNNGKLDVTTELQTFGLIVTAEPYFAVAQPSDVVVMQNYVKKNTEDKLAVEAVDAKYELLQRGLYTVNVPPSELKAVPLDKKTPLDLYEARNAVRIARWAGADKYAAESFKKADLLLRQAETFKDHSKIVATSREVVQTAEDSRLIAMKNQDDQRIASEKQAAADSVSLAKSQAERAQLQADEDARHRAQAEADQRREAEFRIKAEADRAIAQSQAATAQAQAAEARESALKEQAAAEKARQAVTKAEDEKAELRASLAKQLNLILETRDTARGLIVNISDVLFDFDQYTLKAGAREKLAKVSGIVMTHPGLKLDAEGHTDSIGSDDYNQNLSEKRAGAVRDFLAQQGIPSSMLAARGLGKSSPVASNDSAEGRQQNRRVELVVTGDAIGIPLRSSLTQP